MNKHQPVIVPVFLTNQGCPHRCIFCCGRITAGPPEKITYEFLRQRALDAQVKGRDLQIAFYGGNFTGLDLSVQQSYLDMVQSLVREGVASCARISTRPDFLDKARVDRLAHSGVLIVEIGAESLDDCVLEKIERGHTSADVARAVGLLKDAGISVVIHLMAGLPGDTQGGFLSSVEKTIALRPAMVRVHPTIVFKDTRLATLYERGEYSPLEIDEAVILCKAALLRFCKAGIPVIRMGLQTTPEMEKNGNIVAGPFHPSFGALVEGSIFLDMALCLLDKIPTRKGEIKFVSSHHDASFLRGEKNRNLKLINAKVPQAIITVVSDKQQPRGTLLACSAGAIYRTTISES